MMGTLSQGSAGARAGDQLEKIFRKAFAGGMKDVAFAEVIGRAVTDNAFSSGGNIQNLQALGSVYSAGMGPNSTMRDAQARISGFEQIGQTSNKNGLLSALKFESVKNLLGPNGGQNTALALSGASWQDLVGGTEELDMLLGKNSKKIRQQTMLAGLEPLFAQLTASGDGAPLRAQAAKAGGLQNLFQDPKARSTFASLMKNSIGGDYLENMQGLEGFAAAFSDGGEGSLGNKTGGLALGQKRTQAQIEQRVMADQLKNAESFFNSFAAAGPMFESLKDMGKYGSEAATESIKALNSLFETLAAHPELGDSIRGVQQRLSKTLEVRNKATSSSESSGSGRGQSSRWK
jgi:hypothetical protein